MSDVSIRLVSEQDNAALAGVIRATLAEYDAPVCGSALGDPELDFMAKAYSGPRSAYFVAEREGEILGGAGVAQLENADFDTCELRKMYLSKKARGIGIGAMLMDACLQTARDFNFDRVYLETFPSMADAQKLYLRCGFYYLDARKGGTGHSACEVWMQKDLNDAN